MTSRGRIEKSQHIVKNAFLNKTKYYLTYNNYFILQKMDLSIRSVTRFRQEFCVDQLINNLRVEQPGDNPMGFAGLISEFQR